MDNGYGFMRNRNVWYPIDATYIGVTQLEALPSLVAGWQDAGVPRQLRNAYYR